MSAKAAVSLVLLFHHPFVALSKGGSSRKSRGFSPDEIPLFEMISRTCLPLLELFSKLERNRVPFALAAAFSPVLCSMLQDERLVERYLDYLDKKIEFGRKELERSSQDPEIHSLAKHYYEADVERRIFFTEHCEADILGMFRKFQKLGRIEILSTAATYAFLPFYASVPEIVRSQLETAVISHRRAFGSAPRGFWLPEFGWSGELENQLLSYGFTYTMADARALALGSPPAQKGVFYPVKAPSGLVLLGRDFQSRNDLVSLWEAESSVREYQKHFTDAGFELSLKALRPFLGKGGLRCSTGCRYHNAGRRRERILYSPHKASQRAAEQAGLFLENRVSLLEEVSRHMEESPLSLCAFNADAFGRSWYEGTAFLEALFREGAKNKKAEFVAPRDYLEAKPAGSFQTVAPGFSSWAEDGYAESWLDASNDWMYRHVFRSIERMIELAGRFPNDSGLKERALNQAARELLLSLGSDWPGMLYGGIRPEYAGEQIEESLRNFTTIFESLGSNYISTEWLTGLEKRHNVFPFINYRVFSSKR